MYEAKWYWIEREGLRTATSGLLGSIKGDVELSSLSPGSSYRMLNLKRVVFIYGAQGSSYSLVLFYSGRSTVSICKWRCKHWCWWQLHPALARMPATEMINDKIVSLRHSLLSLFVPKGQKRHCDSILTLCVDRSFHKFEVELYTWGRGDMKRGESADSFLTEGVLNDFSVSFDRSTMRSCWERGFYPLQWSLVRFSVQNLAPPRWSFHNRWILVEFELQSAPHNKR